MRAVLDANVFYSTWVTDPLLSFADVELYEPVWSERIMEEVRRHLPSVWSRAMREGVDRYLRTLSMAFPEASVADWGHLEGKVKLPDPDDRHVVAVAIKANADVIVTSNLADFPAGCLKCFGLRAMSPDAFLDVGDAFLGGFEEAPASYHAGGNQAVVETWSDRIRWTSGDDGVVGLGYSWMLAGASWKTSVTGRFPKGRKPWNKAKNSWLGLSCEVRMITVVMAPSLSCAPDRLLRFLPNVGGLRRPCRRRRRCLMGLRPGGDV